MYWGKHNKKSYGRSKKSIALLVSLVLIIAAALGSTIAFLIDTTDPITNRFVPSQVTTEVEETRENGEKKDVYIQNTGETDAWIRAAVVVTWQNGAGEVYSQMPAVDRDYVIVWGDDWLTGDDGFYYWPLPVAAKDGVTGDLIESCTYLGIAPDGYFLNVEILGSGIQSEPDRVFDSEWKSSGLEVKRDDNGIYLGAVG